MTRTFIVIVVPPEWRWPPSEFRGLTRAAVNALKTLFEEIGARVLVVGQQN
jgi:hypothetical protein